MSAKSTSFFSKLSLLYNIEKTIQKIYIKGELWAKCEDCPKKRGIIMENLDKIAIEMYRLLSDDNKQIIVDLITALLLQRERDASHRHSILEITH